MNKYLFFCQKDLESSQESYVCIINDSIVVNGPCFQSSWSGSWVPSRGSYIEVFSCSPIVHICRLANERVAYEDGDEISNDTSFLERVDPHGLSFEKWDPKDWKNRLKVMLKGGHDPLN
jgi:hypothetical protein